LDSVLAYLWPGNIRELEHAIERACAFTSGCHVDLDDLPETVIADRSGSGHVRNSLADRERGYILAVLDRNHGDRRQTANELGMSLATLKRRLRGDRPTSSEF
jgi:transcriptional regulator of acetoin/glycerol metabolism